MRGKKLLMLGGSTQQVPAIEKAKELGLQTVLIDYLPDNPGQYVADKWYQESTTDIDAVYKIAKEEKVDGILAYASDPAALPAAIVADKLGLLTNPVASVEILGLKHKFRQFLKDNAFPCPEHVIFSPKEKIEDVKNKLAAIKFPIVIKPTDSSGSKGVSVISDLKNLEEVIKKADIYSRNKILIAEEFIERSFPEVIGGDIFVEDGKITLAGDMQALRGKYNDGLIPIGEKFPNDLSKDQKTTIYKLLENILSKLEIKTGEFNIEILLGKNDEPYILELGPRAGGNMIPIQLSDAFGVDLIEANILASLGYRPELKPVTPSQIFMTYVLHSNEEGFLKEIGYSEEIKPYIYREVLYRKPGEKIEKFDGAGKAIGIVFLKFPDLASLENLNHEISQSISVKINKSI